MGLYYLEEDAGYEPAEFGLYQPYEVWWRFGEQRRIPRTRESREGYDTPRSPVLPLDEWPVALGIAIFGLACLGAGYLLLKED